jgi:serine/threonine protein kinase
MKSLYARIKRVMRKGTMNTAWKGNYRVIRELGQNLFGGRVTFLAEDVTCKKVVIKEFQFTRSGANWDGYKAVEREIATLQHLDHPSIPKYLNSFETDAGFCLIQEYKDARSLGAVGTLETDVVWDIAHELLQILVYLQEQTPPIIHRDIKPENVLIDAQRQIYLVDFGFAKLGLSDISQSSTAMGTFGFMAPEQLLNRQITTATDLYGVGATLICMLCGIRSVDLGQLIDESMWINFRPQLKHLSKERLLWMDQMVAPQKC